MSHQITCPTCNTRLAVDKSLLGKTILCGQCNTTIKVAPAIAPIAAPAEQNFSALPSIPQATSPNPYKRASSRKPPSNKPIIVTAVVGACLIGLIVVVAVLVEFLPRTSSDQVVADAEIENSAALNSDSKQSIENPATAVTDTTNDNGSTNREDTNGEDTNRAIEAPTDIQTTQRPAKNVDNPNQAKANGPSKLNPLKPAPKPTPVQLVELEPASDSGLQRVQVPEGYSIAVPSGFLAANRSIHHSTAIYSLVWKDGTRLTLRVTDDRSITPNSPIPPVYASTSPDGKQTVRPILTSEGRNSSETYKLNRMNVAFFELARNVSHEDMTEQIQFMFSGAMTPEMKRQYAPLMQEKIAFQSSLVMKAMDKNRTLDIVLASERPQPFAVPEEWMGYLKTLRPEENQNKSLIPRPFLHRYNPPR